MLVTSPCILFMCGLFSNSRSTPILSWPSKILARTTGLIVAPVYGGFPVALHSKIAIAYEHKKNTNPTNEDNFAKQVSNIENFVQSESKIDIQFKDNVSAADNINEATCKTIEDLRLQGNSEDKSIALAALRWFRTKANITETRQVLYF